MGKVIQMFDKQVPPVMEETFTLDEVLEEITPAIPPDEVNHLNHLVTSLVDTDDADEQVRLMRLVKAEVDRWDLQEE